ncbi:MAG: DUF3795 domain-containing protein [Desulfomonilia bacterium]
MMLAYCGMDCEACEAYKATLLDDDVLRARIAQKWSHLYHSPILPEHINCTGCLSDGVKTPYCEQVCEIRTCCRKKGFETCAPCGSFPCDKLEEVFAYSQEAREALLEIRKSL